MLESWLHCTVKKKKNCFTDWLRVLRFSGHFASPALYEMRIK